MTARAKMSRDMDNLRRSVARGNTRRTSYWLRCYSHHYARWCKVFDRCCRKAGLEIGNPYGAKENLRKRAQEAGHTRP